MNKCPICGKTSDVVEFCWYPKFDKPICKLCANELDIEYINKYVPLLYLFLIINREEIKRNDD